MKHLKGLIPGEEEFQPRAMVPWFHPFELARTAIRALLAQIVTAYADSRMAQAGAAAAPSVLGKRHDVAPPEDPDDPIGSAPTEDVIDLSDYTVGGKKEIWFDYLADTGEGFDATYAVASVAGQPHLEVEGLDRPLPRGKLLLLGGDNVYPWPSREHYRDRFQVPYAWAMPDGGEVHEENVADELRGPLMLALPGNHDWYDGLGNFMGIFCDGQRIGGWRTVQRRSYFAVRLPHDWTIWANDTQLSGSTDRSQMAYFRSLALKKDQGRQIILCTPKPAWLEPWGEVRRAMRFFEEEILRWPSTPKGVRIDDGPVLPVVLAGDLHFYARHEKEPKKGGLRHRIVCGGGGAYTRGTQDLPEELSLYEREEHPEAGRARTVREPLGPPDASGREHNRYLLNGPCYPDRVTSAQMALGALRFPLRAHNLPYLIGSGLLYAAMAGLAQWASLIADLEPDLFGFLGTLPERARSEGLGGAFVANWEYGRQLFFQRPAAAALPIFTTLVFTAFFERSNPQGPRWTKLLVGTIWVLLCTALFVLVLVMLVSRIDGTGWVLLAYGAATGFLSGALTGLFLCLVNRLWGWNSNEVFSCQSIRDYHSFLRCHIDENGTLSIYPIGVEVIPTQWRQSRPVTKDGSPGPVLEPVEQPLRAHLIERAIEIPRRAP